MVFPWTASLLKSPGTFLSILADISNAVVCIVSTRPHISKSCFPSTNPLGTVPRAPITVGINVTFMSHSFFQLLSKVQVLIHLFSYFQFYSVVSRDSKINNSASSFSLFFFFFFLLLDIIRSGRLVEIRWSVCMSRFERNLCILPDSSWVMHIPFIRMIKFQFFCTIDSGLLCPPDRVPFYTRSVLICCIRLLCNWSFLFSHHIIHLQFCFVSSILALIWLVLMASLLLCCCLKIFSFSLKVSFLNPILIFSCEMSLVSRLKCRQSYVSSPFRFLVISVPLVLVSSVFFLVAVICLYPHFSV